MDRTKLLARQIERLERKEIKYQQFSQSYSWARLASIVLSFLVGAVAIYLKSNTVAALSLGIVFFVFGALTYFHTRLKKSIAKFSKMISIYKQHSNRLNLQWENLPENQSKQEEDHPYGFDLDIYGPFSLLRLLDQTVTIESSDILNSWLLNPDLNPVAISNRQNQVKELSKISMFRNKLLALSSDKTFEKTDSKRITGWLNNFTLKTGSWVPIALTLLAILNITFYILHQKELIGPYWYFSFMVYLALHLWNQIEIGSFFSKAFDLADDFRKLFKTFQYIENFSVAGKKNLQTIFLPIQEPENKPTKILKKLNRNIAAIGFRMNPVTAIILNLFIPWDYLVAFRLKKTASSLGGVAQIWFNSWYSIDALSSLAQFAWLNPGYSFAHINDAQDSTFFKATDMGHPLINSTTRKQNYFNIDSENRINIITGSNMSGKSTFLRTVGINLTLAYAGAPVCANQLNTQIFKIHSCIRINDSLSEGLSYFYAEVKRLKEILQNLDQSKDFPVLFLIDEIFKGTNNKERLIGSLSYIKELAHKNGIGLVSTHDLELVALQEDVENLKNFHFREDIENGKMVFDYQLHNGPSPTTNALKIMELEGLPVFKDLKNDKN